MFRDRPSDVLLFKVENGDINCYGLHRHRSVRPKLLCEEYEKMARFRQMSPETCLGTFLKAQIAVFEVLGRQHFKGSYSTTVRCASQVRHRTFSMPSKCWEFLIVVIIQAHPRNQIIFLP